MIFCEKDIERQFPSNTLQQGKQLFNAGNIDLPMVQRGGEVVTGKIRQSDGIILRVFIRIMDQQDVVIHGECSCQLKENCQHVVAVLLASLTQSTGSQSGLIGVSDKALSINQSKLGQTLPQVLLYILQVDSTQLTIDTIVCRKNVTGGYQAGVHYNPQRLSAHNPPRFLQESDIAPLHYINKLPHCADHKLAVFYGDNSTSILKTMISTGRCFWSTVSSQAIQWGQPRSLHFQWETNQYGQQSCQWHINPAVTLSLFLPAPWYYDETTGVLGPLETKLPNGLIEELQGMSWVEADNADAVQLNLDKRYPDTHLPKLQVFDIQPYTADKVSVCLELTGLLSKDNHHQNIAALSFKYGDFFFKHHDPAFYYDGKNVWKVHRDMPAEDHAIEQIQKLGLTAFDQEHHFKFSSKSTSWLQFQAQAEPKLRALGWQVSVHDDFKDRMVKAQQWFCKIDKGAQTDWFDITLGVKINGEQIDLVPALVELLRQFPLGMPKDTREYWLPLTDGRFLPVSTHRLQLMLDTLLELYGDLAEPSTIEPKDGKYLQLHRLQLSRLSPLTEADEESPMLWLGEKKVRQLTHYLRHCEDIPAVSPPLNLGTVLRPYQKRGLDWLQFLRQYHLAGILADDMGLGKTVQTLAHLLLEKQQGRLNKPCLVIAPTSLLFNWRQEIEKFCPEFVVLTLHGSHRHRQFDKMNHVDIILSTYPLLVRDKEQYLSQSFYMLILDEAQTIKNPKSQVSQIAKQIDSQFRLCLTGTPMENHLQELWSLYEFLLPGLLGSAQVFNRLYRTPIEKNANQKKAKQLASRIQPFLLRRLKNEVLDDLPDKTEITLKVSMGEAQRELYESVRLSMHRRIQDEIKRQGMARCQIIILDAMLKLRQVCCDPRLLSLKSSEQVNESAKLEALLELIPEMIEEGRRILVFSQFTTMLELIENELLEAGLDYAKLTGQTQDRETQVNNFQQGKLPLFLISLKAGGVGLNLTAADTVIHYDPWWNPAVEKQATDRAHRIGQKKAVFVYKLICEGSMEEKMQSMQQRKQALADSLYHVKTSVASQWTEQDLERLFSPLNSHV